MKLNAVCFPSVYSEVTVWVSVVRNRHYLLFYSPRNLLADCVVLVPGARQALRVPVQLGGAGGGVPGAGGRRAALLALPARRACTAPRTPRAPRTRARTHGPRAYHHHTVVPRSRVATLQATA